MRGLRECLSNQYIEKDNNLAKRKVKVVKTRQINTYAEMWRVSYWAMRQAEKEVKGSFFQIMASLIFTAFTLEAYLNHIGRHIFECWDDLERLSPSAKINVIAEKLKVEKDNSIRPFQTAKKLFDFRNDVAHGKTILLKNEEQISIASEDISNYMHKFLETDWEEYSTLDNAKRAREDVEKIITIFHNSAGITDDILFFGGMESGSATLVQ